MKQLIQALCSLSAALPFFLAAVFMPAAPAQENMEIGGQKIVTLSRTPSSTTRPEFTSITVAPGRGMEVLQITANFPGKGNVDVLASPDLAGIKKMLDVQDTPNGDLGYRLGAAFLFPYPNRIRGKLSADGKTLTTEWHGHTITLPANNIGKLPTAERHAMHGLILKSKTDDVIDYYQADQILNKLNAQAYGIALDKAATCMHLPPPPSAFGNIKVDDVIASPLETLTKNAAMIVLQEGDQDAVQSIVFIRDVVHTISGLPGQRTLILVSPGFLSLSQESMAAESQLLNLAAASAVTISTLDARGLYSTMIPASEGGDQSMQAVLTGQNIQDRSDANRQNKQVMAEFADGTGGTFFRNDNDLKGGLASLAAGPDYKYLLELSISDVKQNGSYHALKVQVDRKDVKIQARDGYFAPQPPKKKK